MLFLLLMSVFKQETDPMRLRELCLAQPKVSEEEMRAQIREGIAWRREDSKPKESARPSRQLLKAGRLISAS